MLEIRKRLLALSLAKPRENVFKTYDLFIYGDIQSIATTVCKILLKIATSYPRLWIVFLINIPCFYQYILLHMMYRKIQKKLYMYDYSIRTHSSRLEFYLVVRNT